MSTRSKQFQLNPGKSKIEFKVRHMMLSRVTGHFREFEGSLSWNPEVPTECSASATIQVKSIDTKDTSRDRHLIGPDFFDALKYPSISFSSHHFLFETKTSFHVDGELTMHGVKKPVILHCTEVRITESQTSWKSKLCLKASTQIRRKDFGLRWNTTIEAGGIMVGDDIEIRFELEFDQTG
ncbi:MAG: YceI family protein [Bdellovibrionales bacterium]|nr:YceI family protein [Bdellovibrionales bacterium]